MQFEVVIGLETHVQLSTRTKIFSGASTQFGAGPNTQASAVDLALPGTLPVLNRAAVEKAIQFGLAVGADIAPVSIFARKNYFYPDLPKGYQISQFENPVLSGGTLSFVVEKGNQIEEKVVNLTRAHLEEDAGKSLHEDYLDLSGIDLNRAGIPLLEVVSDPDMRSAAEAVAYARTLHALVTWLDVCDGNMQEGSFRFDANVSVRPFGQAEFGTRVEIKNLNSFRHLEDAINFEVARQIDLIESGGRVVQATRLYDPDRRETREMRTKEDSQDYRYFPDPDLPPLVISPVQIDQIRALLPELPDARRLRFISDYGLSQYDAGVLTQSRAMSVYYENLVAQTGMALAKQSANWLMGEVSSALNRDSISIDHAPVSEEQLSLLLKRISDGTVSNNMAKDIFFTMWATPSDRVDYVDSIIDEKGLKQISDVGELEKIIDDVLLANPKTVEEFRSGRDKAFNALVGQTMKATKGKGNPQQINELLRKKLTA